LAEKYPWAQKVIKKVLRFHGRAAVLPNVRNITAEEKAAQTERLPH
jgi:hypothetical protein